MTDYASRPELHPSIAARRHIVDGAGRVVLTDTRDGQEVVVGEREWDTLRCADSTRDIEGIRLALESRGRRVSTQDLRAFFEQLAAMNMLRGPKDEEARPTVQSPPTDADKPSDRIRPLDGYRFICGGQGHCCETYATVLMTPEEELRARNARPEVLNGDHCREQLFTPERGARDLGASCIARVEGGCAYFLSTGGCGVHRAGGADAKPKGCQLFPLACTDDGEHIHISVRPECACVFDSLTQGGEGNLLETLSDDGTNLPSWVPIHRIPEPVLWTREEHVTRAEYRERRDALLLQAEGDVARALWETGTGHSDDDTESHSITAELNSLYLTLEALIARRETWDARGGHIMVSLGQWSAAMKKWVATGSPPPPPVQPTDEHFALRALAFTDAMTRGSSVSEELRHIALLIWSARILCLYPPAQPVEHPLALAFSVDHACDLRGRWVDQKSGP